MNKSDILMSKDLKLRHFMLSVLMASTFFLNVFFHRFKGYSNLFNNQLRTISSPLTSIMRLLKL